MERIYMLTVELRDEGEYEEAAAYVERLIADLPCEAEYQPGQMHIVLKGERALLTEPITALCESLASEAWEWGVTLKQKPLTPAEQVVRAAEGFLKDES